MMRSLPPYCQWRSCPTQLTLHILDLQMRSYPRDTLPSEAARFANQRSYASFLRVFIFIMAICPVAFPLDVSTPGERVVVVRIDQCSAVPVAGSVPYRDCLVVHSGTVPESGPSGTTCKIQVAVMAIANDRLTPMADIKAGQVLRFHLIPDNGATRFSQMRRVDRFIDLETPLYFALSASIVDPGEVKPSREMPDQHNTGQPQDTTLEIKRAANGPNNNLLTEVIDNELKRHGGDWQTWQDQLATWRSNARRRIAELAANHPNETGFEARNPVLSIPEPEKMFECAPLQYLSYLLDGTENSERWVSTNPALPAIIAVHRWLASQGISLILVPVPKMTEVYPGSISGCPTDRIVAPHMRRFIQTLNKEGVAVIDLLPDFLNTANKGGLLYLPADPHWSPVGLELAADILAERLRRDLKQTQPDKSVYRAVEVIAEVKGAGWLALSPDQQTAILPLITQRFRVVDVDGKAVDPRTGPAACVVIGDSYSHCHEAMAGSAGAGLAAHLAWRLKTPVVDRSTGSSPSQQVMALARDTELLKHTRTVVWVLCNTHFRTRAFEFTPEELWVMPSKISSGMPPGKDP